MDYREQALTLHEKWQGKIEMINRCPVNTKEDLSVAYTPGVAQPCIEISKNTDLSYKYTRRGNLVAVITDGSAVLGLGDIGPEAGMPVMEGKCVLFKAFADIDAVPLCIRSKDTDEIVRTVSLLAGSFGGINLEDISAPRCFEIERRLKEECDIPVFHDDQHGTAVVSAAAMIGACRLTKKDISKLRAVVAGAGAAAIAVTRLLMAMGLRDVILCDRKGTIYEGRSELNAEKSDIAKITNRNMLKGTLADAMSGADVVFGLSGPGVITEDMVRSMNKNPIVFVMSNPEPEIYPDKAISAGAAVVGTGRSDFPNQINNLLAFPGIFRGALDVRASDINEEMKIAAAYAIANLIDEKDLRADRIIVEPTNPAVAGAVAEAVKEAARETGVARM